MKNLTESNIRVMKDNQLLPLDSDFKISAKVYYQVEGIEAFEFETSKLYPIEQSGEEIDYFRLEMNDKGEILGIFVANTEEFYIFDDASYHFDLKAIEKECRLQMEQGQDVSNMSAEFADFLKEEEQAEKQFERMFK